LALFVVFQAIFHFRLENVRNKDGAKLLSEPEPDTSNLKRNLMISAVCLTIAAVLAAFLGGYTGQAYALATVATAAKTFGNTLHHIS
jgi:Na+/H+ antiporter NhaD/arsenite permease-like protein